MGRYAVNNISASYGCGVEVLKSLADIIEVKPTGEQNPQKIIDKIKNGLNGKNYDRKSI